MVLKIIENSREGERVRRENGSNKAQKSFQTVWYREKSGIKKKDFFLRGKKFHISFKAYS